MTRLKAVLFDLGGTLVKTAAIPEIYKRILGSFGVGVDTNQILEAHKANEKEIDVDNGQIELGKDFWGQWNLKILRSLGVEVMPNSWLRESMNFGGNTLTCNSILT